MAALSALRRLRHLPLLRLPLVLEANGLGYCLSKDPVLGVGDLAPVVCADDLIERTRNVRLRVTVSCCRHLQVTSRARRSVARPGALAKALGYFLQT